MYVFMSLCYIMRREARKADNAEATQTDAVSACYEADKLNSVKESGIHTVGVAIGGYVFVYESAFTSMYVYIYMLFMIYTRGLARVHVCTYACVWMCIYAYCMYM
jgi:hypothetical protein